MELLNRTPLPAFAFRQFDKHGGLDCVVAVRGTFRHVQDGALELADKQEEFQWEDAYDGDPHQGVLLRQTDLTPQKPGTDVTFLGSTYAPGRKAAASWLCGLKVGPVQKSLRAHGKRFWRPVIKEKWAGFSAREARRVLTDWQLTEAEPTSSVPICWSKAYGGQIPGTGDPETGTAVDVEAGNPLGCGIVNLDMPADISPVPAPQITGVGENLDWKHRPSPEGFGPIPPWWLPRQRHAGTYDDAWIETRHPLLPRDFDARFWQCAHPDLVATPHLRGDEAYELANLHPHHPVARGHLPGLTFGVHYEGDRDEWHVLKLDGMHFDWRTDGRVMLTWRARFPLADAGETMLTLTRVRVTGPQAEVAQPERETA